MATPVKRGDSWHCKVFSHYEITIKDNKQIKKRIYKSFTVRDPTQKGKKKCQALACQFLAEKEVQQQRDKVLTFEKAFDSFLENRKNTLSPNTYREYKGRKKEFSDWYNRDIYSIMQEDVQKLINNYALDHKPKTVRNLHGLISTVMKTYRPEFVLRTKLPQKVRVEIQMPSNNDIKTILEHFMDTDEYIPVLLAIFGPMRRGEVCALNYEDIKGNKIHVSKSMAFNDQKEWVIKPPKTLTSDRYIIFPDFVIQAINPKGKSGRIYNCNPNQLTNRFKRSMQEIGMSNVRYHDLRHYCCSYLHSQGMPDQYIMDRGGWISDAVMKNVYRHSIDEEKEKANKKINDSFQNMFA